MKKTSLALVAIALLGGIVMFSAFTPEKEKSASEETLYFRFAGSSNDAAEFLDADNWTFEGIVQPTTGCAGGPVTCIFELPGNDNPGIDPDDDAELIVDDMVTFLNSRIDVEDYVEENTVLSKP